MIKSPVDEQIKFSYSPPNQKVAFIWLFKFPNIIEYQPWHLSGPQWLDCMTSKVSSRAVWEATMLPYFTILIINFYRRSKFPVVLNLDKKDFHASGSCEIEGSYILKVTYSYWFTGHIQRKCCAHYWWKLSCNVISSSKIKDIICFKNTKLK